MDDRPIEQARPPAARLGARCHGFSRLTVAFLRSLGVPARARCGFASYFMPGKLASSSPSGSQTAPPHIPREHLSELRNRFESDDRLRMDGTVFNAALGEFETV